MLFLSQTEVRAESKIAPIPKGEEICADYDVFVDGKPVPVYACLVSAYPLNQTWPGYQRPKEQAESAGFAYWEMSGSVKIEVVVKRKVDIAKVTIRPLSLNIQPERKENRISFTLKKCSPIVVEINDYHHALHLFPDRMRTAPADKTKSGLHYFGPDVHDIGVLHLKSGESVYVDAGAVVYGSIHGDGVSNISVEGPGIIDASRFERGKGGGVLHFSKCKNVRVDGIIMKDPDVWTVNVFNCDEVEIKNSRLIGLWRYNSDGIDICNCRNVLVEGCFVRSFDDSLVLKGLPSMRDFPNRKVTFRKCVVWCDWGRALEVGAETCTPEDVDIVYEDCDVIRTTGIAMDIQHYDEGNVHNIRFENIRVEFDDWIPREVFQNKKDQKYIVKKDDNYCSRLMVIVMPAWRAPWSSDRHGTTKNVVFKNITIYSNRMPPSSFSGYTEAHNVDGVRVENVRFAGKEPLTDAKSLNLSVGKFVKNLTILP